VAERYGYSQTLVGRYRKTTKYFSGAMDRYYWHGLRASINTPIQGGAADIVIAAMVGIGRDRRLKEMGWNLVL
jgi:DNA polymerase-1